MDFSAFSALSCKYLALSVSVIHITRPPKRINIGGIEKKVIDKLELWLGRGTCDDIDVGEAPLF